MTRAQQDQPRKDRPSEPPTSGSATPARRAPTAPGDEAPAGTPGTGQSVCRMCGGKGQVNGRVCPECQGSGTVIAGIGGA